MGHLLPMSKRNQGSFIGLRAPKDVFGGSLLTSHPKVARPLDSKLPTHLVLRAERSQMRQPRHFAKVNQIVKAACQKHGVRLYEYANMGNHLHLLLKLRNRPSWSAFIREVTGRIAQLTQTKWAFRPFTRIVRGWRAAYERVKLYMRFNTMEVEGLMTEEDYAQLRLMRREFG